jgi:hypothetical protein
MDKNKIVLVIGVMLFLGTSCYAGHYGDMEWADMWWKGDDAYDQSIDSRWNEPRNWYNHVGDYDMVIPGPNEIVNLNWGQATYPPIIDNNNVGADRAECNDLWMPDWQSALNKPFTLLMVGGELYIHKDFVIGRDGNDSATRPPKTYVDVGIFNLVAGAVTVDHNLSVGGRGNDWGTKTGGIGTINITGGTITCAVLFIPEGNSVSGAKGPVNLNGGIIDANMFAMDANGFVYVTDGKLIVDGNKVSQINGYISSGKINVGNPAYTLEVVYDSDANTTTLFATSGCGSGADLYSDCFIDIKDLAIMAANWLAVGSNVADLNGDGIVNFKDYAELAQQWHTTLP